MTDYKNEALLIFKIIKQSFIIHPFSQYKLSNILDFNGNFIAYSFWLPTEDEY